MVVVLLSEQGKMKFPTKGVEIQYHRYERMMYRDDLQFDITNMKWNY